MPSWPSTERPCQCPITPTVPVIPLYACLMPCRRCSHIGIGITSGTMIVGNMGSDLRFSYTVMGDEVNRGARLEGVTKEYGTPIIISEATWEHIKDRLATRELDI